MQPETPHVDSVEIELREVARDVLGDHRADLTEHHLAVLAEHEFLRVTLDDLGGVEETEVVADVVGELRDQARAEHLPAVGGGGGIGGSGKLQTSRRRALILRRPSRSVKRSRRAASGTTAA